MLGHYFLHDAELAASKINVYAPFLGRIWLWLAKSGAKLQLWGLNKQLASANLATRMQICMERLGPENDLRFLAQVESRLG